MQNALKLFLLVSLLGDPALAQTGTSSGTSSTPKAASIDCRCMAGQWHEQVDNGFRWVVEVRGNRLKLWRTDHFVSGSFRREGSTWKGDLKWGNGETWHNVWLTPTDDCEEVRTNQSWWFKRN